MAAPCPLACVFSTLCRMQCAVSVVCAQVRIGVGEQGDSRYLKPQVRESGSQLWWGEVPWLPSSIENSLCQDIGATSIDKPGTLWVRAASLPVYSSKRASGVWKMLILRMHDGGSGIYAVFALLRCASSKCLSSH